MSDNSGRIVYEGKVQGRGARSRVSRCNVTRHLTRGLKVMDPNHREATGVPCISTDWPGHWAQDLFAKTFKYIQTNITF